MAAKNIFFAHSGGVTAVLNPIAFEVIREAKKHPNIFNKVLIGKNGILGAINEELIDTSVWDDNEISKIKNIPASIFGSCRHKLTNKQEIEKIFAVFKAHNIGYFIYNGGNDSQDTTNKLKTKSKELNYPLVCIGIPKTIDNDLPNTDTCPGFGSAAKYIATSILEASLDIQSMHHNSTKVFILEVMGRNAGWLAAAASLAHNQYNEAPHIILFPEVAFNKHEFLNKVQETVQTKGFCVIVASEGINYKEQQLFKEKDAFGHPQLGGIAPFLANAITETLNYKTHWSVADYLQRSARHIASLTDMNQALALGREAINYAARKQDGVMLTINRTSTTPYQWQISSTALENIANCERKLPKHFISKNGWQVTKECKEYLRPLIQGEAIPPFKNGIPDYTAPTIQLVTKKLTTIKA